MAAADKMNAAMTVQIQSDALIGFVRSQARAAYYKRTAIS
jgi:hypothetical protein